MSSERGHGTICRGQKIGASALGKTAFSTDPVAPAGGGEPIGTRFGTHSGTGMRFLGACCSATC